MIVLVLVAMTVGAAWAATRTPIYRSTAVVSGPADLATIVRSSPVAEGFRSRVGAVYGNDVASTTVGLARQTEEGIELSTDSQSAGVAEDLTSLYVESVLAVRPEVVLETSATFPLSPRSPNLGRTAFVTFLIGAVAGWAAAVVLERWSTKPDRSASEGSTKEADPSVVESPSAEPPTTVQPSTEPPTTEQPSTAVPPLQLSSTAAAIMPVVPLREPALTSPPVPELTTSVLTPPPKPVATQPPPPKQPATTPPAAATPPPTPQPVPPPIQPAATPPQPTPPPIQPAATPPQPTPPPIQPAATPPQPTPPPRGTRAPRIGAIPRRNLNKRTPSETPRVVTLPDAD